MDALTSAWPDAWPNTWSQLVAWGGWGEPLFLWFALGGTLVSMLSFTLFAAPMTWIAWKDPPALRRWRIQAARAGGKPVVWPSIRHWTVNNALQLGLTVAAWPMLRLAGVHLGPLPAWWVVVPQVVFFVYLDDFLYYWVHRGMHRPWLYRRVHGLHHRVPAPWAVTGHSMHPVEYLTTTALMLVGPLALGVHVATLYVWIVVRQWEAAEGHCGYDLPWTPSKLLPGSDGAAHHDFHHSKRTGNYGGFLPVWDRVFGTLSKGYEDYRKGRR